MSARPAETRQCPYCRCTFHPTEPGQRYCSPLCERAHKAEAK